MVPSGETPTAKSIAPPAFPSTSQRPPKLCTKPRANGAFAFSVPCLWCYSIANSGSSPLHGEQSNIQLCLLAPLRAWHPAISVYFKLAQTTDLQSRDSAIHGLEVTNPSPSRAKNPLPSSRADNRDQPLTGFIHTDNHRLNSTCACQLTNNGDSHCCPFFCHSHGLYTPIDINARYSISTWTRVHVERLKLN